ncbi:hypothetical protein EV363DRAFT_1398511 [Boletus edulis]|uniref:Uncharacterized protein n=1 Tax=Boletus edulis BED1 TaxID=1328754 RepID=A0AAD4GBJ6_BOLED|nr:hypothetical protein EV363DRAFT_1398511 [Boletus edulis]KAF8435822.1 hypothetical protein L210DRAFT_3408717 [Boletus edulis BED1]
MHPTATTSCAFESMTPPCHSTHHASSIPVTMRHGHDDSTTLVNANAPQCCHCGWRGAHSPSCPFR